MRSLDWDEPIFVSGDVSLRAVASTLDRCHVGAVVVARRGGDAGIVSERDIVAAIAAGAALDRLRAGEVATRDLISADPGDRIIDVAQRLIDEGVRHVARSSIAMKSSACCRFVTCSVFSWTSSATIRPCDYQVASARSRAISPTFATQSHHECASPTRSPT